MNCLWNQFPVSYVIASQFVRNNLTWFTAVFLQESLKESLCALSITPLLQEYINYFTILINGPLQIILLPANLNEHFINEESITIPLMFSS